MMRHLVFLLFAFCFLLLQADPLEIAENYRDLIWYVESDNILGNYTTSGDPQQGYTDEYPCDWVDQIGEYTIGMPYQYGGRDDFDEWTEDYVNGVYGPGGHSVHYPGSLGWAAGIDCSGFVGRCWEIDEYTLLMYFNCTYIANNYQEVTVEELQPGDCFVKSGVHARLFYEWGEDNNVITVEATSGTYNRVLQYEYDLLQDIINQGYVLRRNIPLSAGNEIPENEIKLSNYPNPFNPSTMISFETTNLRESARIEIYNLKGQKVRMLPVILSCVEVRGTFKNSDPSTPLRMTRAGNNYYSVTWNGDDDNGNPVSSGIYLYRLKAGDVVVSRKCLLLK
ncbi:MAG: hypothetical protein Q7J16_07290 [Candidatus Cloacimonadales bacterium]|nr:hypothetical protein [Candidatus Cloacimonadales bacterium]